MSAQDLFAWRDEVDAAAAVAQAEAERAEAERAAHYAPHGKVLNRRARLQAATHEALRRELALQRLQEQKP